MGFNSGFKGLMHSVLDGQTCACFRQTPNFEKEGKKLPQNHTQYVGYCGSGSVVGIATDYGDRIPVGGRFSAPV